MTARRRSFGPVARRRGSFVLAVFFAFFVAALAAHAARERLPGVAALARWSTDQLFRLRGTRPASPDLLLVAIDEASVQRLAGLPLSRAMLADAIDRLAAAGARVIVLDLLLDRTQPATAAGDPDSQLESALRRAGRVVLPFGFVDRPESANAFAPPPELASATFAVVRQRPERTADALPHPAGLLLPLPRFLEAARPAHATIHPDADGVLRRFPLAVRFGEEWYRGVPVEAVRLALGLPPDRLLLEPGRRILFADRAIALDASSALELDFRGPTGTIETVSFVSLMANDSLLERIAGRIVVVGVTALAAGDRYVTPFDPGLPGVELLATAIDNLLTDGGLVRLAGLDLFALSVATVLSGGLALVGRKRLLRWAVTGATAVLWLAVVATVFSLFAIRLDPVLPVLALLLVPPLVRLGSSCLGMAGTARSVSVRAGEPIGSRRAPLPAAVLFTDLAGFTRLGERLSGVETADLLRRLHATIEACVARHGGEIVDYTGDGAFAVFGLAGEGLQAAAAALACGRDLLREVARAGPERLGLACRVGIHFGPVTATELGGPGTAQATIVGDTVNVASRLEQLNKELGSRMAVSDAVVEAVRACGPAELLSDFVPRAPQQLRGRDRPLGVWTLG
ncbi:Adenylate cyclase 1 [bacterium HR40]|nr:Adenylate cyclase 1 [bacterium HR40]